MPLTNTFGRMPLERIWVHRQDRQRRDLDLEAGGFLASIALRGVIMPVILEEAPDANGYHVLHAGERRYAASLTLGLPDIPFRFVSDPSPTELQIIEFEENAKRKDLTWQETCQAVVRLHALHKSDDPTWTFDRTGEALGWSDGTLVSKMHFINASWTDDAVRGCGTANEAYNLLQRRQKRAQASKLEDWLGEATPADEEGDDNNDNGPDSTIPPRGDIGVSVGPSCAPSGHPAGTPAVQPAPTRPPASPLPPQLPIAHGDFLSWAPSYAGPKFNLIHCDFPYGVDFGTATLMKGPNRLHREEGELYHDGPEHYDALLAALVEHFDRFASESCHLMFWYSNRWEVECRTREALGRVPGLTLLRFPIVWHKSDNAGFITPGHPRHIYETALLGVRGDRPIVKYVSDTYSAPSDNSLHMSAKPEPMLRYFMGMLVDEHTRLLDPTCGSGSALRAAEALRAERVFGLEASEEMARTANTALLQARATRRVAEVIK